MILVSFYNSFLLFDMYKYVIVENSTTIFLENNLILIAEMVVKLHKPNIVKGYKLVCMPVFIKHSEFNQYILKLHFRW
jgi:hypothetical protein